MAGRLACGVSLYPEAEGQSSPERPPARRQRQTFRRALLWIVGVATFLALAAYAVGGRSFFRQLLQLRRRAFSRIEESLQPPTQAEIAAAARAAARDTASVMASDKPPSASAAFIITSIVVLILLAFAAFYLSGRRSRVRNDR